MWPKRPRSAAFWGCDMTPLSMTSLVALCLLWFPSLPKLRFPGTKYREEKLYSEYRTIISKRKIFKWSMVLHIWNPRAGAAAPGKYLGYHFALFGNPRVTGDTQNQGEWLLKKNSKQCLLASAYTCTHILHLCTHT